MVKCVNIDNIEDSIWNHTIASVAGGWKNTRNRTRFSKCKVLRSLFYTPNSLTGTRTFDASGYSCHCIVYSDYCIAMQYVVYSDYCIAMYQVVSMRRGFVTTELVSPGRRIGTDTLVCAGCRRVQLYSRKNGLK